MGYTHYFKCSKKPTAAQWQLVVHHTREVFRLCQKRGITLVHEYDEPGTEPEAVRARIFFNGEGGEGHETFSLEPKEFKFEFCKTARKPYDAAVVAVLRIAEKFIPGFSWSSDGDPEDNEAGIGLANETLVNVKV
jgi:hypothetical protein